MKCTPFARMHAAVPANLFRSQNSPFEKRSASFYPCLRLDERYWTRIDGNTCKPGLNVMLGYPTVSLGEPGYKTKVSF